MSDNGNKRILLVDDNLAIHQDFIKILGKPPESPNSENSSLADARAAFFGSEPEAPTHASVSFELESAYQGEEAYELVQKSIAAQNPYAMAFVDVRMPPGWDGVQTIKKLWEVDSNLQVVICTAFADYSWDDMMKELGSSDRLLILKKPFDPVEVCQFASSLTEKWNISRSAEQRLQEVRDAEQEARSYAASLEMVNKALETAKATAEAAAAAKSSFLANMSHEIRTPMVAILGYTDLLADPSIDRSAQTEYLETVQTNGRHLLSILDDILDITRIESGNLVVKAVDCSLQGLVHDVQEMVRLRAEEKSLAMSIEFESGCPEQIHSDPTRLRQILLNLVSNAVKFTEHGTIKVSLSTQDHPSSGGSALHFAVEDTGIGISKDDLGVLFESFTQADNSSTREHGGTGLGLAISRRLARILGGDIVVASELGQGSTFQLVLPLSDEVRKTGSKSPQANAGNSGSQELATSHAGPVTGNILLAEDFVPTQRLIGLLLRKAGANVDVASNGQEAVDLATKAASTGVAYDLIIMDMQMPVLDGYQATGQIRNAGYAGPIVALTAHATVGDREKCLEAGCTDYATKPIDRRQLLKLCRTLMTEVSPPAPLPGEAAHESSHETRQTPRE